MRADLVVLEHLPEGSLADVVEACEEVLIQEFLAIGSIEPSDPGILIGFPWRVAVRTRELDGRN
jgi:hypothetical protein